MVFALSNLGSEGADSVLVVYNAVSLNKCCFGSHSSLTKLLNRSSYTKLAQCDQNCIIITKMLLLESYAFHL